MYIDRTFSIYFSVFRSHNIFSAAGTFFPALVFTQMLTHSLLEGFRYHNPDLDWVRIRIRFEFNGSMDPDSGDGKNGPKKGVGGGGEK
jgi:hypothetical protein